MSLGNISEFAFNRSGDWLALVVDARDMAGNGLMLKNLTSNELQVLDSGHFFYKNLSFRDEKGQALSVLKGPPGWTDTRTNFMVCWLLNGKFQATTKN